MLVLTIEWSYYVHGTNTIIISLLVKSNLPLHHHHKSHIVKTLKEIIFPLRRHLSDFQTNSTYRESTINTRWRLSWNNTLVSCPRTYITGSKFVYCIRHLRMWLTVQTRDPLRFWKKIDFWLKIPKWRLCDPTPAFCAVVINILLNSLSSGNPIKFYYLKF